MKEKEEGFNIPIVLFIFKRRDKIQLIIDRIKQIEAKKIYIIADGARNKEEENEVIECREKVEKAIDWDCEIIKNYAEENRGVYENIAGGARWVFEKEESAIFLEDDNLPEISFFKYCKELLEKYKDNEKILWICGTNYLGKYEPKDGSSYMFTKNLMPCGWASWGQKFNKHYDGTLKNIDNTEKLQIFKESYKNKKLYKQQLECAKKERKRIDKNLKPRSWDYQMTFSIRANDLYGISPKYNQITNIGVDENSIHGGNSYKNIMTRRFCSIPSYSLEFPLKEPNEISINNDYEKKIDKIILYPLRYRVLNKVSKIIRQIFNIQEEESIKRYFKSLILRKE